MTVFGKFILEQMPANGEGAWEFFIDMPVGMEGGYWMLYGGRREQTWLDGLLSPRIADPGVAHLRYWKRRQFGTPAEMMAVMQTILDKQLNPRICEFLGHRPLAVKHIQHNRWRLIFRWEKAFFQGLELPDVETTIQPVVSYVAGGFFIS